MASIGTNIGAALRFWYPKVGHPAHIDFKSQVPEGVEVAAGTVRAVPQERKETVDVSALQHALKEIPLVREFLDPGLQVPDLRLALLGELAVRVPG